MKSSSRIHRYVIVAFAAAAIAMASGCRPSGSEEVDRKHEIGAAVLPIRVKLNAALKSEAGKKRFPAESRPPMSSVLEYGLMQSVISVEEQERMILAYMADTVMVTTLDGATQVLDFANMTPDERQAFDREQALKRTKEAKRE